MNVVRGFCIAIRAVSVYVPPLFNREMGPIISQPSRRVLGPIILTLGASDGCPPCLGPTTPECSETGSGSIAPT